MRIRFALSLVLLAAACAPTSGTVPSGERGGRVSVVADFSYVVGRQSISGSFDPRVFNKDGVLGHVRRSCKQYALGDYSERRTRSRVTFQAVCRRGLIDEARGRWIVQRGDGGNEVARKL